MVLIDEELLQAAQITEAELRIELALIFYQQGRLSLGRCAALAALPKSEFEHLLFERQISRFSDDQIETDLKNLETWPPLKNAGNQ